MVYESRSEKVGAFLFLSDMLAYIFGPIRTVGQPHVTDALQAFF